MNTQYADRLTVVITILIGSLIGCESYSQQKASEEQAQTITRDQTIEDLDFLTAQLKEKHPNPFGQIPEDKFLKKLCLIKDGFSESVAIRDFSLSVAALLASVRDDHTRHRDFSGYYEHLRKGGKLFPVKLRYRNGHMVVESLSPQVVPKRLAIGNIVLSVNDESMESLVQRYGQYLSLETDLQRQWAMDWWFDKYQVLLGDARKQYTLTLRDGTGEVYEEKLPAVGPWLEQYEKGKSQGPNFAYQFYDDGNVCLFRIRTFAWDLRKQLEKVLVEMLDAMRQKKTECVVLDLRGNSGGNGGLGMSILRLMIDKSYADDLKPAENGGWPVQLVLLCDRSTYSAASWLAMVVKDCNVGIIAGEETGGRASFFGDLEHITLPHSRLSCAIGTKFFMRRAGYDDRRGVLPDLPLDVMLDDASLIEKIITFIRAKKIGS
ncbi:MAG: hypothetical protein JW828_01145 [Sedimentisphaerales bacterium]|nr:hypothetical protein [Sedimentisphaerales bacterium]